MRQHRETFYSAAARKDSPAEGSKNSIIGPEIDMWAFGVMLYEMCTAYKPTKLLNYRYGNSYKYLNSS